MSSLITHLSALHGGGWIGYLIVFLLVLGESTAFVGFFVPGSIVTVIAGGLASQGIYDFWTLSIVAILAALIGNTASYELGRQGTAFLKARPRLWKHVEKGQIFFEKHGKKSVFIGHFLGPVRHAVPVAAGASGMRRLPFQLANVPGAILWALTHLAVGYLFGSLWNVALIWSTRIGAILVGLVILIALIVWFWRWFLSRGPIIVDFLTYLWHALVSAVLAYPGIQDWARRHARLLQFVYDRISVRSFFGLPFTLLVIAFIYIVSGFVGLAQDIVTKDPLAAADVRIDNLLYAFRDPTLLHIFYYITLFAQPIVLVILALLLSLILWIFRERFFILSLWLTIGLSEGLASIGKLAFHRVRPDQFLQAIHETSFSFPSTHATSAVALYGLIAYLIIRTWPSWKAKVSAFFCAFLLVFLIDFSRMYLGVHYLSDVLAGNLIALSVLVFTISITEWLLQRYPQVIAPFRMAQTSIFALLSILVVTTIFVLVPLPKITAQEPPKTTIRESDILPLFGGTLSRTTETLIGTPQEPIDLIFLASKDCLIRDLATADWKQATTVSIGSLRQAAMAALLNQSDITAPMTPSFYNGRPHDLGFEKQTSKNTVRSRHHARFWETSYQTASGTLFVGTVSLDTGIKWGITHAIAPDVDTERDLLFSDLKNAHAVATGSIIPFVQPTLGRNFTGDFFFTDGGAAYATLRCE